MSEGRLPIARRKLSGFGQEFKALPGGGRAYTIGFGVLLVVVSPFLLLEVLILLVTGRDMAWFPADPYQAPSSADPVSVAEVIDRMDVQSIPALQLIAATTQSAGFSKIGGVPDVTSDFQWPRHEGTALGFTAQLDFAEVPQCAQLGLPRFGRLYFFYVVDQSTWGMDPSDAGSWRVLYDDGEGSASPANLPADLPGGFAEKRVDFREIKSLPALERLTILPDQLSMDEWDEVEEQRRQALGDLPGHQVGGFPDPIQGDGMELECDQVAQRMRATQMQGHPDSGSDDLNEGSAQWCLLLQLDTDDEIDMMWGDAGMVYFWIRSDDLAKCDFSRVWMILQCH